MFALMMFAAAASAPSPLQLETQIFAETRVAAPDGTTRIALAPPERVGPGDTVVVRVTYRNAAAQPLGGVVIANPVPAGLAYRAAESGAQAPELSVDGEHYGTLDTLRVALPGGGVRPAHASEVSHVRWRLAAPLPAGTGGQFAFRATVK